LAHREAHVEHYIMDMVRIDRCEEGELRAKKVQHLARRDGRIRLEIARRAGRAVRANFKPTPALDPLTFLHIRTLLLAKSSPCVSLAA